MIDDSTRLPYTKGIIKRLSGIEINTQHDSIVLTQFIKLDTLHVPFVLNVLTEDMAPPPKHHGFTQR